MGPLYGGAIIEWIGWRWIFWLDIPQSFILIALLALLKNRANPAAKMDYLGALALGGALTVITIALSQRSIFSGESVVPYLMAALGVCLVATLVVVERRAIQPLLAAALYRSKAFLSSNVTQFLVGVALIIALVTVPLMAATVMEKKAWESALHLVRLTIAIPVGALVGGYILRWTGSESGVHYRPCLYGHGPTVHEWLGYGSAGAQANFALDRDGSGIWAGHTPYRGQRFERRT